MDPALLSLALIVPIALLSMVQSSPNAEAERYAMVVGLKPDQVERYKMLHANTWPGVLNRITECNIRNYSIHLVELKMDEYYLFSYFEYVGDDFEADMNNMAEDETTLRWWKETDPTQIPIETAGDGEQWTRLEEVFYHH